MTKKTLNQKLDEILKNQKVILANEKKILGKEDNLTKLEEEEIELEKQELKNQDINQETEEDALKQLEDLEKELKKIKISPLKKVTKRDLFKGFVGAFIGVIGHYAFAKAIDLGEGIEWWRALLLYIISFFIIVIMLYYTGFRKVKYVKIYHFLPLRALVLYGVSFFTVFLVYFIFGKIHFLPFEAIKTFKIIAPGMVLAVVGAGMADLIGKIEE